MVFLICYAAASVLMAALIGTIYADRNDDPSFPVIVCGGENKVEQGFKDVGDWWKVYGTRTKKVTHWMPLPAPPKEAK